ncbi:MAG: trypsin-like peptidase domain-containing protein [Candidatus Moraniibacteriota bacterium]
MPNEQPDFPVSGNAVTSIEERTSKQHITQPVQPVTPERVVRTPWMRILLLSFLFGLIGGSVARFGSMADITALFQPAKAPTEKGSQYPSLASVPLEDQAIVGVVDRGSPAVVSIVITKDVPKVRNFFRSPFLFPGFGNPSGPIDDGSGESTKETVGNGSGFLVSADGYIITNKHVVSDTKAEYTVITSDKKEFPATVLALDPVNDVAVIKVNGDAFPALPLGDSDTIRVGQTAIAIGNPLGEFANSVSRGIISGLKRRVVAGSGIGRDEEVLSDIIQTDAAINPGNSGGPLLNLAGEVIGINVAVAQGAENIGFAIPVNQIKRAVDEVKRTGKITVPYLGVRYILLDEAIAQATGLSIDYGALIQRGQTVTDLAVVPGSPADKAGLVENDIILEIDGQKVDGEHPLANLIGVHQVGDTVKLKILHKGEEQELSVRLEERK